MKTTSPVAPANTGLASTSLTVEEMLRLPDTNPDYATFGDPHWVPISSLRYIVPALVVWGMLPCIVIGLITSPGLPWRIQRTVDDPFFQPEWQL